MEIAYYNLSGGINKSSTKTELGLDTRQIYWADAENIEILQNKGICKQKGNTLFLELPSEEAVTGMFEMYANEVHKLVITTENGKIYIHNESNNQTNLINKTLNGINPIFTNFLNGTIIATENDSPFYIDFEELVHDCNLTDYQNNPLIINTATVYKGRVWFASGSTIYYSALGTYDDFETENDAGYISDFHTDTSEITAIKPYKDYLAIYKKNNVYLLTGSSPENFSIIPFANKGCIAPKAIENVDNKQFFLSNGIFALEQVGELNQIQLGNEISLKIKPVLEELNSDNLKKSFCLHYENKSQMWFFFPYPLKNYYNTVWINDYINKAWYKRIIPQNITTACVFKYNILTADENGKIYKEDFGTTFNGEPIKFLWKSPFLALSNAHHKKLIDEFYFILDEEFDNNFDFSVYKNYDSQNSSDEDKIYSVHFEHLLWADNNTDDNLPCHWALDEENIPIWSVSRNTLEKAEISESNYAIQLCVSGNKTEQSCAIIGLQFREIYNDD